MTSTPWGGHPTLQTYLDWLRSKKGFTYKMGIINSHHSIRAIVEIYDKNQQPVWSMPYVKDERLAPSEVELLDINLNVSSPFSKPPR